MKTFTYATLAAMTAAALLPVAALAVDDDRLDAVRAASTAQAADFSDVAPARDGTQQPSTNPSPGSLQPQSPAELNTSRKPGDTENGGTAASSPTPSASGLTAPGASSGSSLGSGSNGTISSDDNTDSDITD